MNLLEKEQKVRQILEALLDMYDMTEMELSRQCKLSQPAIHKILSGATPDPRLSSLKTLAKFFNISLSQLSGEEPLPLFESKIKSRGVLIKVPLIPWEEAFEWQKMVGGYTPASWTYWATVSNSKPSRSSFALTIERQNAVETFTTNSVIIVDPEYKFQTGNHVVVYRLSDQSTTIKELQLDGQEQWLVPLNKKITATRYDNDYKICGVILQKNVPLVIG